MKNEFALAFNEVLEDKQLPKEVILEALQAAMVSAYRRAVNASNAQSIEAKIDSETGQVRIYAEKEVVDAVQDERTEVSISEAQKIDPDIELGGIIVVESTPRDFGRVAAQTARQVIQQRIREAERDAQFNYFARQSGEIISGVVQAITNGNVTLGIDMKAEGLLPYKEQIPGERFRMHERVRALLHEVKQTPRGPQIILSRSHRNFLRRLLENEVPEIYHGMVEIRSIAREPGHRSKVAVAALKPGVEPVGACVGVHGVRIQAIVRELHDEKIDVIEWNPDPGKYIEKALSPARVSGVYLNELAKGAKTATVVVPEDHLSLAIGRDGQNARLAAKLTGWRIDIKSLPEAVSDLLYKLDNDGEYMAHRDSEKANLSHVRDIMVKKSEGRPITPEEYSVLNQFVDRVERAVAQKRQSERKAKDDTTKQMRAQVPAEAFEIPIEELEISQRICALLRENGYETIGDLTLQMNTNADKILGLQGIGPKAIDEIRIALEAMLAEISKSAVVEATPETPVAMEIAVTKEELPAVLDEVQVRPPEAEAPAVPVMAVLAPLAPAEVAEEIEAATEEAAAAEEPASPAEVEIVPAGEIEETEESEEELEQLFQLTPEGFEYEEAEEEEEEDESERGKGTPRKKKKSKKKRFVEMEYDPDKDVMIVKKKHKRGGDEWGDY